jgi:mannose-6-phosphate isomerase-like protein (cupin superfamily)
MTKQIMGVAERLKELREICDFSLEKLALAVHVPPETYALYESGEVDIPISVLLNVAEQCGVEPGTILTGEEPKLHEFCVTRAGKGKGVERHKDYQYQSLAYSFLHKKMDPFLVRAGAVPAGTPLQLNAHEGQEFDYLLEGRMRMVVNGKEIILEEGDSVYLDASYPHAMQAIGSKDAVFLAFVL